MSSRKISSESFSSVGSDCLESPDDAECPFSRAFWNGRSPAETRACPFDDQVATGARRAARRKRVNLDSLGESLRRLTSPTLVRLYIFGCKDLVLVHSSIQSQVFSTPPVLGVLYTSNDAASK
ncbi:guanylate cyclase soluble subunit alpha-2 isoform X1, partial [Tachysurus ichikawai]